MADQQFFTRKQAAAYLHSLGLFLSAGTLKNYATHENAGRGPPFTRYRGFKVVYAKADLETWARKQVVRIE